MKVKIEYVDELFVGAEFSTEVWISDKAWSKLTDFEKSNKKLGGQYVTKLAYYATAGFRSFEFEGGPIRYEWDGVLRIALKKSLFRVVGFYAIDKKTEFIAMDAFMKRKHKLSGPERERINEVARIRDLGAWKKRHKDQ